MVLIIPADGPAQPRLIVEGPSASDVGTLYEGQGAVRRIAIRNEGDATLHIARVWTSCGCTAASLQTTDLLPGQRESLAVSFETANLQGEFKREVHLASNDTHRPQVDLTFTGTIIPVVIATPRYISFGTRRIGHPEHQTVQIKNTIRDTIRVLSYSAPDPQLRLSLNERVIPPDSTVVLGVDLTATGRKKILGQIELKTDCRLKPSVRISYIGRVN